MTARGGEYRISIDRVGWAIGIGAAVCGVLTAMLVVVGGDRSVHAFVVAALLGAVFSGMAIAAIGGPVWLTMHAVGWRGPAHAAAAGAAIGFVLMLAAEIDGGATAGWPHAIGGALLAAALAGTIALAMWRVAYGRQE